MSYLLMFFAYFYIGLFTLLSVVHTNLKKKYINHVPINDLKKNFHSL